MNFAQTDEGNCCSSRAMCKIAPKVVRFFYSGLGFLGNEARTQVVQGWPAHVAKSVRLLHHTCLVDRCAPCISVSSRVYPRAKSVHRFERVAGFAGEERCRRATRKPIYGRGCAKAAVFCKLSLSCGVQVRTIVQWMQNTCATFAQIGGAATGFCKYSDIRAIESTWVPASAGSSGCSVESSTTTGHSLFTTPVASICNVSPACGLLTTGALPNRKAARPAPHPTSHRGNGRCANLPRQQRTRTRKQSRSTLAGRAVA